MSSVEPGTEARTDGEQEGEQEEVLGSFHRLGANAIDWHKGYHKGVLRSRSWKQAQLIVRIANSGSLKERSYPEGRKERDARILRWESREWGPRGHDGEDRVMGGCCRRND